MEMKRVVLIRHAKAEDSGYDDDFNRGLTSRGSENAFSIAEKLLSEKIIPDHFISSPAMRAMSTAFVFAEKLGFSKSDIEKQFFLYDSYSTNEFIKMINRVPDSADTLFVLGHNPYIYYMAINLCKEFNHDMPTCSVVVIDFETNSWKNIEARQGNNVLYFCPSLL